MYINLWLKKIRVGAVGGIKKKQIVHTIDGFRQNNSQGF